MSEASGEDGPTRDAPGVAIGSFADYDEAVAAVDHLAAEGFPVERSAIVGRDLRLVEDVTGASHSGQAALHDAGSGALIGALAGWLLGVVGAVDPLVSGILLALWGALIGAALGALVGLAAHRLRLRSHDFSSVGTMHVGRYEVLVHPDVADRARSLLDGRA